MYGWDTDPWMEIEALETERFEADMLQAEMEAEGRRYARAQKAGVCTHGSTVGYLAQPVYPEQEGLKPGQSKCTAGCGEVFDSDEAWQQAIAASIADY